MSDPIIVGLSGNAGTGKSTCANILVTQYGFTRMAFADPLKDMIRVILRSFGYTADQTERWLDGDLKEHPCPALDGQSCRMALQSLGTEWGRDRISQKLWLNILLSRLDALDADHNKVVVDDVRMDNEADALLTYGWSAAGIYRMFPKGEAHRHPPEHRSEVGISKHLISGDIVHDFTMGSLEQDMLAKIIRPMKLERIGAWSSNA